MPASRSPLSAPVAPLPTRVRHRFVERPSDRQPIGTGAAGIAEGSFGGGAPRNAQHAREVSPAPVSICFCGERRATRSLPKRGEISDDLRRWLVICWKHQLRQSGKPIFQRQGQFIWLGRMPVAH